MCTSLGHYKIGSPYQEGLGWLLNYMGWAVATAMLLTGMWSYIRMPVFLKMSHLLKFAKAMAAPQ